jgi:pimeloyl-ACP methyl ester carboxylesterase
MPTVHHRTALIEGQSIFYREAGDAASPAIVLLHGFPSSSHMFRDLIPLLADQFHVIAPDYVGFGHSSAPSVDAFDYTFDHLAAVTSALLEQLRVDRYTLYMQDFGGPVGFLMALPAPEKLTGLVIQNANAYMSGVGEPVAQVFLPLWANRNAETEAPARAFMSAETTRFQYVHGTRNPDDLTRDGWTLDQALLDRPGTAEYQLALFMDYQTVVARYDAIQAMLRARQPQTLIVWGRHDPFFTPAGAEAYLADVPAAELHWIDGGHFLLDENAGEVAAHINRVFGGVAVA